MVFVRKASLTVWVLIAFILGISVLYGPYLSRTVRYDEAFTYFRFARSPLTALLDHSLPNNHPLNSLLIWFTTSFIGANEIALRFPSFAAGLLAAAYLFRIGKRLSSQRVGLLAGAFMMTAPLLADQIPNGRGYTLSIFLSLVIFEMLYFGPALPTRQRQRGLLIATILLILTLPTMLLLIAGLLLWVAVEWLSQRPGKAWNASTAPVILGSVTGLLIYSRGLLLGTLSAVYSELGYSSASQLITDFALRLSGTEQQPLLWIGLAAGVVIGVRRHKGFMLSVGCLLVVVMILAVIQKLLTGYLLFPRNYLFLLPFIALVAAIGWDYLLRLPMPNGRLSFILAALFLLLGVFQLRTLDAPTPVDLLNAAFDKNARPGDAVLVGCCLEYPLLFMRGSFDSRTAERIAVVPTPYDSLEVLKARYGLPADLPCAPAKWDSFEVFLCPAAKYRQAP